MITINQAIQQSKFNSEYHKLAVNLFYTTSWLSGQHQHLLKPFGISMQQFNILRILRGQKGNPLSVNCHSVQYDRNGDGRIEKGTDLVLQTLFDEWQDYRKQGGAASCVDCHMPVAKGARAAESALIPLEQDAEAPPRTLRSHRFIAVDYPIDKPTVIAATRAEREALLQRAAELKLDPRTLAISDSRMSFDVSIKNVGAGHNLPGGFAFVRQMWLEVTLLDARGALLAASGQVIQPSDDLCDGAILDESESSVRELLSRCTATNRQLVSFQQMLVEQNRAAPRRGGARAARLRNEHASGRRRLEGSVVQF